MDTRTRLASLAAMALAAACSPQKESAPPNPLAGSVKLTLGQQATSADSTTTPAICATFTITPFSLDASGNGTQAGVATTVPSGSTGTAAILGCVHTPGVSPDWRYLVTATDFAACTPPAVDGIAPSIETFTVDITCAPGLDVPAAITASVEVPVENGAGYIDIGVGVNVDTPQAGCKQADIDANGFIHFGQSYVETSGGPTPSAYTGIGTFPAASGLASNHFDNSSQTGSGADPSALQQFEGSVNESGSTDAYFTGLLQAPLPPESALIVQAFAQPCPGQMTVQPRAVECETDASGQQINTSVQIADVFVEWPGYGSVSAFISGSGAFTGLTLETSLAGPNLGTLAPPVLGHDDLTQQQSVLLPGTTIAVFASLIQTGELFALTQIAGGVIDVVALTLDGTSGQWSISDTEPLTSFSGAQQQAMGLFGTGGCFAPPIPACPPGDITAGRAVAQHPAAPARLPGNQGGSHSDDSSTSAGTVTLTFTHGYNGQPVDAAHPLTTTSTSQGFDPLVVHLQWSVSGLNPGDWAYPAVTLCDPYGTTISNTNGGTAIQVGAACFNGFQQPQATNSIAFPALQADSNGGVTQDLQFTIATDNWFTAPTVSSWTIPITLFTSSSATPQPGDTQVVVTGPSSGTVPLIEPHDAMTIIQITSATEVASGVLLQNGTVTTTPGLVYKLSYIVGTTPESDGYVSDFLAGANDFQILPPLFTDPAMSAKLVQGSFAVTNDGSAFNGDTLADAYYAINSGLTTSVDSSGADFVIDGSIENLIGYSSSQGPQFTASWFAPLPTNPGTFISTQGSITWQSASGPVSYNASGYAGGGSSIDISPIPVAQVDPEIVVDCGDVGTAYAINDPAFAACAWMYNWTPGYEFEGQVSGGTSTLFNPTFVVRVPDGEQIESTSINTGLPAGTTVSTSNDASCSGPNSDGSGSATWTVVANPGGPADFSAVKCVSYSMPGIFTGLIALRPYQTKLSSSITSGAAIGATHTGTASFWYTADNVIADSTGNAWGSSSGQVRWRNSTLLDELNFVGATVGVGVDVANWIEGHASGLAVPDLQFKYTIAPGATYDLTAGTPESWFLYLPKDVLGGDTHATCDAIDPAAPAVLTCTVTSNTGDLIAAPGGTGVNFAQALLHYQFNAGTSYNGEQAPHDLSISSSAAWLLDDSGDLVWAPARTEYDTVIGPTQLTIAKSVHGGQTAAAAGAAVPFDIVYGAGGLTNGSGPNSQIGAGGVAIYDFFGKDFVAGTGGAAGTLVAQASGCVAPVPASITFTSATGGTSTPGLPAFYSTASASPNTNLAASAWTLIGPGGAIPSNATAIKIVPVSSLGGAAVLLPVDGNQTVQVTMAAPSGATGQLCNSAALTASDFNPTSTAEAAVTLTAACNSNPWPQ